MKEQFARCDVCGIERNHVLLGPHWERDALGRKFHRYECSTCKAHLRVYENEALHNQDDVDARKPST